MRDTYGSDFLTIADDDGTEYELEVLSSLEYNGATYLAVLPAAVPGQPEDLQVTILKSVDEAGETILTTVDDEQELETVHMLLIDQLYEEEE